ncbi:MAG: hypothetical protein PHE06_13225 [Lachnospiraceae bacterium]|nr:hypothetical protein [Lachnospiraceae bacterium]MDD3796899.1 hypothetical protein [Lachnospiraceae bacterium]
MKHIRVLTILAVYLVVLGFCVSALLGIWRMYQAGVMEYKGLQEYIKEEEETDGTEDGKEKGNPEIDFSSLKKMNRDFTA